MRAIELKVIKNARIARITKFEGPSSWSEMTKADLLHWSAAMAANVKSLLGKSVLAAQLFCIPAHVHQRILDKKERCRLAFAVDFLFKRNQLHTWLIPIIRSGLRAYHGPKSKLSNLIAEEFTLTELCYEKFQISGEIECLDTLLAILYRPRRWYGITDDVRVPLSLHGIERRKARFAQLPLRVKYAVMLNYEGCRNYIHDNNPAIFRKGSGEASSSTITPWAKIIRNGAGGVFGTLAETEKVNIHKFLSELNARIKENNEKP